MGTFAGHALPGSFFLLFAFWQSCDIYRRYFASLRDPHRKPYINRASISSKKLPLEAVVKLTATSIGIIGETYTGFRGGHFVNIGNGQHISMFAFFAINALFDLAYFYKVPAMPKHLDYMSSMLAFAIEGLLFRWHMHGRTPMDVQLHSFLTYAIFMCILGCFLEMMAPTDVRPALIRTGFTFLQGTWFWQVGQILYPVYGDPWIEDDHEQMLIVTMMFTWHIAAVLFFMALLGVVVYLCTGRLGKKEVAKRVNGLTEYKRLEAEEIKGDELFSDDDV